MGEAVAPEQLLRGVNGGDKAGHWSVEVQHKCHSVKLRYYQMMTPVGPPGMVAMGEPRRRGIFLMVPPWIPNFHSIARSDIPLRRAFWIAFHLSL